MPVLYLRLLYFSEYEKLKHALSAFVLTVFNHSLIGDSKFFSIIHLMNKTGHFLQELSAIHFWPCKLPRGKVKCLNKMVWVLRDLTHRQPAVMKAGSCLENHQSSTDTAGNGFPINIL